MLGIIGGFLQFKLQGLIIGQIAVVFTATALAFWLPLYGIGNKPMLSQITKVQPTPESVTFNRLLNLASRSATAANRLLAVDSIAGAWVRDSTLASYDRQW